MVTLWEGGYAGIRAWRPETRAMALARYSGDCAPVTMTLPPKMKQGNDVAIESLKLATRRSR
jgi:hypothetical protein